MYIGERSHYLTVIAFSYKDNRRRNWFLCKCDCGKEKVIMGAAMRSGNTKSCGCYSEKMKKERSVLPNNLGVKRHILLQYKRHARGRNIEFNLSESDFIALLPRNCHYCGCEPANLKKTKNCKEGYLYNGVDRKKSEIGYQIDNCVPCCGRCNMAKGSMSDDVFLSWVKKIHDFNR